MFLSSGSDILVINKDKDTVMDILGYHPSSHSDHQHHLAHHRASPGSRTIHVVSLPVLAMLLVLLMSMDLPSVSSQTILESLHGPREYCPTKAFTPRCPTDQVVVMTEARYGRLRQGDCVVDDYGNLGCNKSVITLMDKRCSGRVGCNVPIPSDFLEETKPCPREFKNYLNATYKCVEVENSTCHVCKTDTDVRLTKPEAYLASVVTEQHRGACGTVACPWLIEVEPGQRINVTLYDFGSSSYTGGCLRLAQIRDSSATENTIVCSDRQRVKHVYKSISNSLEITLMSPQVYANRGHFLIHYKAIGCPDLTDTPLHSEVKRQVDMVTVSCVHGPEQYSLECKGTEWDGTVGTCPGKEVAPPPEVISLPLGVLIAIVIGIALVIGVLILTIGIVCLKRQQHEPIPRMETTYYVRAARQEADYDEAMRERVFVEVKDTGTRPRTKPPPSGPLRENVYHLRRMESRPLPSLPNIAESVQSDSDDDPAKAKMLVHRTNSGREQSHKPKVMVTTKSGTGPGGASGGCLAVVHSMPAMCEGAAKAPSPPPSSKSGDDPPYFVLDPEQAKEEEAARQRRLARAAHGDPNKPNKSPEEENAENFNKEVHLNNSCHEIPLRPTRDGIQPSQTCNETNNGNCSWP